MSCGAPSLRLLAAMRDGNQPQLRRWLGHLPAVALVLIWVMGICHIPLWQYLLFYVYPGVSLTLLRSFAEHRAARRCRQRIVTMETNPVLALMFLNNHLHALHHAEPATAVVSPPGALSHPQGGTRRGQWRLSCRTAIASSSAAISSHPRSRRSTRSPVRGFRSSLRSGQALTPPSRLRFSTNALSASSMAGSSGGGW